MPDREQAATVEIWPQEDDCAVCNAPAHPRLGVPMYEGKMVGLEATKWAGFPACEKCFAEWEAENGLTASCDSSNEPARRAIGLDVAE